MQNSRQKQFDELIAPHLETLFRMAYRLVRNAADAQDLVQDTCVAACGSFEALAAADSPLKWLLRVQHNRFIDVHRRRGRSPVVAAEDTGDLAGLASDLPDPEQVMQQFQSEALLEQAFLQLEEMPRTLLSLRAEGYELPEIEAITGVDRNVLSARLRRARLRLAQLIADINREAGNIRHIGSRS
ncbi:MAG TPA: RNA polymerase sigma factor [Steroidobacteraceae bacterium]|nr:RNA polymerase sigma factor [Steroidobacteraceae bacterium]